MEKFKPEWLFKPISIGKVRMPNRIVQPALGTTLSDKEGLVTPRMIDAYEARAAGGIGLMIVESTWVDSGLGSFVKGIITLDTDRAIPGLRQLTERVKRHGVRIVIQINHAGAEASPELAPVPITASAHTTRDGRKARAMTVKDMANVTEQFVQASLRAQKAGFDGVELHAAHGFLFAQFLSLAFNERKDEYGGSAENRARFLADVIRAIKKATGPDFLVWARINGIEWRKNALTNADAVVIARACEAAGADAVNVSAYAMDNKEMWRSLPARDGVILPYAAAIKKAVKVPVIAVGLISPALGEKALREGQVDLIAIGRGLVADPDLPRKVKEGRFDDVRPCIRDMTCLYEVISDRPRVCTVNPTDCRETELVLTPAAKPKQVMVIGGGPGGMEAARAATIRGHKVTLYEKSSKLGGQLNIACVPPYKKQIGDLAEFYRKQLDKLGVRVVLGKEVTPALVKETGPDAVVVATGVIRRTPDIPGLNKINTVFAGDVLSGEARVGKNVVIIGGGLVGCETGEFLAESGKKVAILEILDKVAMKEMPPRRDLLLMRLADLGARIITGVKFEQISEKGVAISQDGRKEVLPADTIVIAITVAPDQKLLQALRKEGIPVQAVGDCVEPRGIQEAIAEGFQAALKL